MYKDLVASQIQRVVSPGGTYYSPEDEDTVPLCPPGQGRRNHGNRTEHDNSQVNHGCCFQSSNSESSLAPNADTHCHTWWPVVDFSEDSQAIRQLIFVSILCFLFMCAQVIGGALANSLSIMTDAAHLSSDLASFLISILALHLKRHRPTKRFSFGYHRIETLGALISILVIWLLSAVLCILAVERIQRHEFDINANEMLIVASLGVAFNIVMGVVLNSDLLGSAQKHMSHGHSHGGGGGAVELTNGSYDQIYAAGTGRGGGHGHSHTRNLNIRAAFIHVIGDLVQSVGVLIAAILIKIDSNWKIADPICTFVFSVIVLATTITVLRDIVIILVEAVPLEVDYDNIRKELEGLLGVLSVHNLHIWNLSTSHRIAIVHLTVRPEGMHHADLIRSATKVLVDLAGAKSVTVQVEDYKVNNLPSEISDSSLGFVDSTGPSIYMNCNHCRKYTPM